MSIEKELCAQQAKTAANKAVEYLETGATGLAKQELLNAVAAIEKLHQIK